MHRPRVVRQQNFTTSELCNQFRQSSASGQIGGMVAEAFRYFFGNRALLFRSENEPMQTQSRGKLAGGSIEFGPPFRRAVLSSRTQPCQSWLGFPTDDFRQRLRQIRPDAFSDSQIMLPLMAQRTWPFRFGNQLVDKAVSPPAGITDAPNGISRIDGQNLVDFRKQSPEINQFRLR